LSRAARWLISISRAIDCSISATTGAIEKSPRRPRRDTIIDTIIDTIMNDRRSRRIAR